MDRLAELEKENKELKKDLENYRELVDDLPDIVQSVDPEGRIAFVNRRATEILGYEKEELLSMMIDDLYAPEIWKDVGSGFQSLIKEGKVFNVRTVVIKKNGERLEVEVSSTACYDKEGNFKGTRSILRDIRLR